MIWSVIAFDGGDRLIYYETTKRLAEQRQRKLQADDCWDDVVILPGLILQDEIAT